ncbi:MAG: hypothetical protein PWP48_2044 [Clostridiales bacterium]|jgi:uncharacterized membrane protein YkoI|nr:hypothetical protein [Clostridiales bacterium]
MMKCDNRRRAKSSNKNYVEVILMLAKEGLRKAAIPVLAGAVVLGSLVGFAVPNKSSAAPQKPPAVQQTQEQSPSYKASIFLGQQDQNGGETADSQSEAQEDAAIAAKARITKDDAIKAVSAAYPGYTIKDASLGNENGYLIYEVTATDTSSKAVEVKVDAGNAKVLASDNDSEDKGEAAENESGVDNDNVQEEVEE